MLDTEKAYLAGIIDGEGSIMLTRFNKGHFPAPCVSIASTSLELLEWVKEKTGVGTIKTKKNYKPSIHQDSFTYTVRYNDAIQLLEIIEPYLVISSKKARARLILSEYKLITPRNGRYSEQLIKAKTDFHERFIKL